jgi:hypothetical protein
MPEFNPEARKYEHVGAEQTAGQPKLCACGFCRLPIIADAFRFGNNFYCSRFCLGADTCDSC